MESTEYKFTKDDYVLAKTFAKLSSKFHKSHGRPISLIESNIIQGKLGEIAFAKMVNEKYGQVDLVPTKDPDPGWDFEKDGHKIDVKTVSSKSNYVTINLDRLLSHEYAVISIDKDQICKYLFSLTREEVRKYAFKSKYTNSYALSISKIMRHKFNSLKNG